MKKRVLIILLIFVSCFNTISFAERDSGDEYVYTLEELEQLKKETNKILAIIKSNKELKWSSIDRYARVPVRRFEQENFYYCGPATVKQTMDSVTGYSESQSYYARKIGTSDKGTDFKDLAAYLRRNAHNNNSGYEELYVYEDIESIDYSYWLERIYYCLHSKQKPPVLDVYGFTPTSTGHFINIDIIDVRGSIQEVRVVDPNNDRRYGGTKWYDANEVYRKNIGQFKHHALW